MNFKETKNFKRERDLPLLMRKSKKTGNETQPSRIQFSFLLRKVRLPLYISTLPFENVLMGVYDKPRGTDR